MGGGKRHFIPPGHLPDAGGNVGKRVWLTKKTRPGASSHNIPEPGHPTPRKWKRLRPPSSEGEGGEVGVPRNLFPRLGVFFRLVSPAEGVSAFALTLLIPHLARHMCNAPRPHHHHTTPHHNSCFFGKIAGERGDDTEVRQQLERAVTVQIGFAAGRLMKSDELNPWMMAKGRGATTRRGRRTVSARSSCSRSCSRARIIASVEEQGGVQTVVRVPTLSPIPA